MTGSSEARERAITEAARRLLDMLTLDGDPPALAIPNEVEDKNAFAQVFDSLSRALSVPSPCAGEKEGWRRLSREEWAKIVCEWDEANKGQCRCAKNNNIADHMCSGCIGVADTIIGKLSETATPSPPRQGVEREKIARVIAPELFEKYDMEVKTGLRAQNGKLWADVCYADLITKELVKADAVIALLQPEGDGR